MSEAVSRDLALSTIPFVRLFNAPQLRICVLLCVIHLHARAKHHQLGVSSQCRRKYQRENAAAHLDIIDETGILICGAQ